MSGDADAIIDELEEFLTGARHVHEPDRILATVLFTDIAGSTKRQPISAIAAGGNCLKAITRWCAAMSRSIGAGRSILPATVF